MSIKLKSYAATERTRAEDKAEFLRDARRAVIEWWKVMYPRTWFLRFISIDLLACGWLYQLRCAPFCLDLDHWFFKKWALKGNSFRGFFGCRIATPDIIFKF